MNNDNDEDSVTSFNKENHPIRTTSTIASNNQSIETSSIISSSSSSSSESSSTSSSTATKDRVTNNNNNNDDDENIIPTSFPEICLDPDSKIRILHPDQFQQTQELLDRSTEFLQKFEKFQESLDIVSSKLNEKAENVTQEQSKLFDLYSQYNIPIFSEEKEEGEITSRHFKNQVESLQFQISCKTNELESLQTELECLEMVEKQQIDFIDRHIL
eukprot:CAMPEP_0178957678 /NCGR_PEP_ID=MMETSP0789-20121207/11077_1 /TAXON_ID=3005 /ORGANISM="Rhizosolenia setigera, Strain CCMP 1694" /LENGTH=214 /DNA_ID=CAMNT_0020640013 /DNA_START=214 /DNA_END=858 /DNA_ORIENTATION=+